jgi:hypothetical protein
MSASMARQEGWVQCEQSDTRLAWNMAKMTKGMFSRAAIWDMQYLIKNPRTAVCEEKKQSVVFPGHNKVEVAIETHLAKGW